VAELGVPRLAFDGSCPDCGSRHLDDLPGPLPEVGDDFDWRVRDYDGFRLAMLEELSARFPERTRWTPADLEVVLVEALAAVLDQLSDMADRVAAEAYLETARRPESVRRHLALVGYDAVAHAVAAGQITPPPPRADGTPDEATAQRRLAAFWRAEPSAMDAARRVGPRTVRQQRRMVSVDDHAARLEEHPLVERAHASVHWSGSWTTLRAAVVLWRGIELDDPVPDRVAPAVAAFHQLRALAPPVPGGTVRTALTAYLDRYRMAGQEVVLGPAELVPIVLSLSVRVAPAFYRSEVRQAVLAVLGTGPDGLFRPGRLRFGEDLHASAVIGAVMHLDGVESVCLNRFKRMGSQHADQVASGRIALDGIEVAVCDDDPARPERGLITLALHGGLRG
jgi:hypothetical protein